VVARSGQLALHNIVATRRFVGHILPLPATRPASLALEWIPEGGRRRAGRPMWTWQDTLKEGMEMMGVDWSDARDLPATVPDGDNSSPDVPPGKKLV